MTVRDASRFLLISICFCLLHTVPVVQAQDPSRERSRSIQERPLAPDSDSPAQVPDWAESRTSSRSDRRPRELEGDGMRTKGPGTPGSGNPDIPLGGLEWLLLAGGGYGLWKLREND